MSDLKKSLRFFIVGDIVGKIGREALKLKLKAFKKQVSADSVIVNVENAAAGFGLTKAIYDEFSKLSIDVMSSGNHIYDKKAFLSYIDSCEKLIRPLNYPASQPGKGYVIYSVEGIKIAVLNAIGRVFMPLSQCPFEQVQKLYERLSDSVDIFILDFHAEATSEKVAMGYACDGKFACVFGTHTHVQTADNRLLPKKTAYISDIGMVGAYDSVIGMQKDDVINKFFDQLPRRFEPPESGSVLFCGIVVDVCVKTGLSNSIERFQEVI